ncbi:MAG: hypothetical protein NVSMB9_23700 [Isosphaeraceae bacterium]
MFEPILYAALFGVAGLVFGGLAHVSMVGTSGLAVCPFVALEVYLALSSLSVSALYVLNRAGFVVERGDWPRSLMTLVASILLPYRLVACLTSRSLAVFDPMDLLHPIAPGLFVGRRPYDGDRAALAAAGVTAVLNLCAESPGLVRLIGGENESLAALSIPVLDGAAPSPRQFRAALDWVTQRHAQGHSILIHCAQGRGRSVTVAAAALCELGFATGSDESIKRITLARPRARISRNQRNALEHWLDKSAASEGLMTQNPPVSGIWSRIDERSAPTLA